MAAPCERCRWRDEKEYTNLDDTEKHFLVLMRGDFQHEMIIPEEFVRRLNGKIPEEVKLQTRNGYSYTIEVSRDHEKLVLTAGWGQFVENFDLQMGDSIIFRYSGNSQFSVIIFDKLGREKALSVVVDAFLSHVKERNTDATETMNRSHGPQPMQMQSPTGTMNCSQVHPQPTQMQLSSKTVNHLPTQSPPMERQRRLQRDKSSQGNKTTMNYSSSESSGDSFSSEDVHKEHDMRGRNNIVGKKTRLSSVQKEQLKDGYITTRKAKLTLLQEEEVKEKVQSILSDIPVFVAVMGKGNVVSRCSLTVPNYYADEYLGNEQSMWLQRFGRNWKVSFPAKRKPHDCRRSIGGWHKFVEDNNMKMGDICLFERLNNQRCTLKVHIIHVKDGG